MKPKHYWSEGSYHESDGPLLVDVDGDVGALDPCVGAEMPEPHVRVSEERFWRSNEPDFQVFHTFPFVLQTTAVARRSRCL